MLSHNAVIDYGDIQHEIVLVNFNKQPGKLRLSMSHVLWDPDLVGDNAIIEIPKIRNQKISADGKSKVQIQLQMMDGRALAFHFTDDKPPGKAKECRNKVKIHLGKLLGKVPSKKIDKEFEERKQILHQNGDILNLYKDLVKTAMITPDEFWSSRAHMLKSSHDQDIGVSGDFLTEVKPQSDGSNSVRYNLTPEMVKIIFRTYPAVKTKYLEVCPAEMSEKDFWTKFFQSQYFHRDRISASKDCALFLSCDDMEAKQTAKFEKNQIVNIENLFDMDYMNDYGSTVLTPQQKEELKHRTKDKKQKQYLVQRESSRTLIRRFNQHSSLVLRSCQKRPAEGGEPSVPKKKLKDEIRAHFIDNNDLNSDPVGSSTNSLSLKNRFTFFNGQHGLEENSMLARLKERQRKSCIEKFRRATQNYAPRIHETILNAQSEYPAVLIELMQDQKKEGKQADLERSGDIDNALLQVKEILTHFWSCFPYKPEFEEKITRMHTNLVRFDENTLQLLEEADSERQDVSQIREMVNVALSKYNQFESKRKRK